ncbi:MAG: hypothetical protein Q8Q42_04595 [Nanoarchaeota archaeon]|nr:hypothetical protein [Nanoarchaeota archaeon]
MAVYRKGSVSEMSGWTIAIVYGIAVSIILFGIVNGLWGLLGKSQIDNTSYNSFVDVYNSISRLSEGGGENSNIPIELKDDFAVVGFSKDSSRVTCSSTPIIKPDNCDGACLCICEVIAEESMCLTERAKCLNYGSSDIDFEGGCNIVLGTGNFNYVRVANHDGKISINDPIA